MKQDRGVKSKKLVSGWTKWIKCNEVFGGQREGGMGQGEFINWKKIIKSISMGFENSEMQQKDNPSIHLKKGVLWDLEAEVGIQVIWGCIPLIK